MKHIAWTWLTLATIATAACSSGPSAADENLASTICREQIGCGYQLADQKTCTDLFAQLLDSAELQACHDCVTKEACATEQKTCQPLCAAK